MESEREERRAGRGTFILEPKPLPVPGDAAGQDWTDEEEPLERFSEPGEDEQVSDESAPEQTA
jgi:hypothetical protein